MKFGRLLVGSVLITGLLAVAPVGAAQERGCGVYGVRHQDPGSGGSGGGDPCSISVKGTCRYSGIYPDGFDCAVAWCEADPAAQTKCASHNEPTCQQGEDSEGNPIYVMVNWCSSCAN